MIRSRAGRLATGIDPALALLAGIGFVSQVGVAAAELWERVDITAGTLFAAVAPIVAGLAMIAFRPRTLPSAA